MPGWSATVPSGPTRGLWWRGSSLTLSTAPRIMTTTSLCCGSGHHSTSQVRRWPWGEQASKLQAVARGAGLGEGRGSREASSFLRFPPRGINLNTFSSFGDHSELWHHLDLGLHQLLCGPLQSWATSGPASKSPAELLCRSTNRLLGPCPQAGPWSQPPCGTLQLIGFISPWSS